MKRVFLVLYLSAVIVPLSSGCSKKEEKEVQPEKAFLKKGWHPPSKPYREVSKNGLPHPKRLPGTPSASPSEKTELMEKMGVEIGEGRILIDMEKSRDFFETLGEQLRGSIDRSIRKAEPHAPSRNELGIVIGDDKIEIDLKQTRKFMQEWVETMEIFGRELNRSLSP